MESLETFFREGSIGRVLCDSLGTLDYHGMGGSNQLRSRGGFRVDLAEEAQGNQGRPWSTRS